MAAEKRKTTDHEEIRAWVEQHNGFPASRQGTLEAGAAEPEIDFPSSGDDEALNHIEWDAWLTTFEQQDLALLYQPGTEPGDGTPFYSLVPR